MQARSTPISSSIRMSSAPTTTRRWRSDSSSVCGRRGPRCRRGLPRSARGRRVGIPRPPPTRVTCSCDIGSACPGVVFDRPDSRRRTAAGRTASGPYSTCRRSRFRGAEGTCLRRPSSAQGCLRPLLRIGVRERGPGGDRRQTRPACRRFRSGPCGRLSAYRLCFTGHRRFSRRRGVRGGAGRGGRAAGRPGCVFRRCRPPIPTSRSAIPIHADHLGGAEVHSGPGGWG